MPSITTNDLKNGMTLNLTDGLFQVVEFQHVKPGKGHAFVRTTLKNSRTGAVLEKTFRAGEKVEQASVDKRDMQYLYREGESLIFMDMESYDQTSVNEGSVSGSVGYMTEGLSVILKICKSEIVGIELPASVSLVVSETEPGIQGDRVSAGTKPATLETGLVVQVPLFINPGEEIKIDTRTGEYMSRT